MTPPPDTAPIPKEPRQQRFCDIYAKGQHTATDAYLQAGYRVSRPVANRAACRLLKRPEIKAYLDYLRQAAASASRLSVSEILEFCARVVRAGIGDLDPSPGSATGDLIKSHSSNEGEMGSSQRIEKHDPFKAIEIHLKVAGEDPAANALKEIAAALGSLGGHTLPTDKL